MKRSIVKFFRRNAKSSEELFAEKKIIRQQISDLKKKISETDMQSEADILFSKIENLPEFKAATTILMYWSTPDELPTHQIVRKWCYNKIIILPSVINEHEMEFKRYFAIGKMRKGNLGIEEPDSIESYKGKFDLVIVPGVAFDRKGNRLGRGKGYYDKFLSENKILKIGVGFNFQLLDYVPVTRDDIKMDKIITATEIV
ncbi:MAG: 5-formyltetrahydrofolate cyclo-ligase [Paludibacter sp.]|nr:5-formyltetrahydrofolate cyclo-ligase [Paludibacter sp.]